MSDLYQALTQRVDAWRAENYPCDGFPAIREILEFATEDGEAAQLRHLRRAQFTRQHCPRFSNAAICASCGG